MNLLSFLKRRRRQSPKCVQVKRKCAGSNLPLASADDASEANKLFRSEELHFTSIEPHPAHYPYAFLSASPAHGSMRRRHAFDFRKNSPSRFNSLHQSHTVSSTFPSVQSSPRKYSICCTDPHRNVMCRTVPLGPSRIDFHEPNRSTRPRPCLGTQPFFVRPTGISLEKVSSTAKGIKSCNGPHG